MKIKYKLKEVNALGVSVRGEPDGSQPNRHGAIGMEEDCGCGCDACKTGMHHDGDYMQDQYGMSPNDNPDENGDGMLSPDELSYHFDLNGDNVVLPDEYEQHVKWHCRHPEVFDYDEQSMMYEKKDRCYRLAKQKYDVFPSAYASGFIVRCRKGKVAKKKK